MLTSRYGVFMGRVYRAVSGFSDCALLT